MELRDLYDEFRNKTGKTIEKGEKVPKGYYYVTVVIFIENSNNEFLIQRRSKDKGFDYGTTGGHPKHGESSIEGIISEVKEEIGIDISKEEIKLIKTIKTEDDFFDIYYVKKDIDLNDIKLQEEEVSEVIFMNKQEILKLIDEKKFHRGHDMLFKDYFNLTYNK